MFANYEVEMMRLWKTINNFSHNNWSAGGRAGGAKIQTLDLLTIILHNFLIPY